MPKSAQIEAIFNGSVVLTSSELVSRLVATGKSQENARKIISRASDGKTLWRTTDLLLSQGARLYTLPKHLGTPKFSRELAGKLKENRPGIARILDAFASRLVFHKVDAMKLLAVGDSDGDEKRSYEREVRALGEIGIVTVQAGTKLESLVQKGTSLNADELAALTTEELRKQVVVTRIILERLRRQAIASWNLGEYPDHERPYVVFNKQIFSGSSISYLTPVVRFNEAKKAIGCPILIDVQWDSIRESHLDCFLQRVTRATHRGRSKLACLCVLVGLDFTKEAFREARRNGMIVMSLRQEFGEDALNSMIAVEELMQSVRIAGASEETMASHFNTFADMIEELKSNPIVVDLRSLAMEATTGFILRSLGYESVELGLHVPWKDTRRDVDVFAFRGDELRIVECKAHHGGHSLDEADVNKFFTEAVPALKKYLQSTGRPFKKCVAEIWTTGPRGQVAADAFKKLSVPKLDEWNIVTQEHVCELVPSTIASRVVPLIKTLGCVKTNGEQEQSSPTDPNPDAPRLATRAKQSTGLTVRGHLPNVSEGELPY